MFFRTDQPTPSPSKEGSWISFASKEGSWISFLSRGELDFVSLQEGELDFVSLQGGRESDYVFFLGIRNTFPSSGGEPHSVPLLGGVRGG